MWIYYYGEKLDITHQFDDDGVCYVQLTNGGGDCLPDCQVSKRLCDEFAEIPLSPMSSTDMSSIEAAPHGVPCGAASFRPPAPEGLYSIPKGCSFALCRPQQKSHSGSWSSMIPAAWR